MREWLSGGVSPCQGEGRGFESRLALLSKEGRKDLLFLCFLPLASNFFCDIITDAKNVNPAFVQQKMPRAGIEPATRGFSVLCSTN